MLQARTWLPRAEGSVRLAFVRRGEQTVLDVLHQAGSARARFPKPAYDAAPEAVLLNMAGGLTAGDRLDIATTLATGARATITTAAAEKIYRALDGEATIRTRLELASEARLAWLPQPTILFDQARFDRRTEVALSADATFLAVEFLLFGRLAMGETVQRGLCRDVWRIRRDGKLAFADTLLLQGGVADTLARSATAAGARAVAMIVYIAPDAASRIDHARALLEDVGGTAGASTWDGMLVVRALANDGQTLQRDLIPLIEWLHGGCLPRVWQC
ncbi:MAG: urease accessory protein UreD [Hyphomicrobiaceae bacterium]|nr:MAG: urease accessory protein UreD [Hyphomicrobiaceae bacterium]